VDGGALGYGQRVHGDVELLVGEGRVLGGGGADGEQDGQQGAPVADVGGAHPGKGGIVEVVHAHRVDTDVEVLRGGEAERPLGVGVVHLAVGAGGLHSPAQGVDAGLLEPGAVGGGKAQAGHAVWPGSPS